MTFQFTKAVKGKGKARVALVGPSGSGKTMTALLIAKALGSKIALIDTENGSASKYAGEQGIPDFDTLNLGEFSPQTYVEAIHAAETAGFEVLVIDSLSHAWTGKGGALDQVDRASKRSQSGNSFTAWREVTPHHNALVDALVQCKIHLIVTMRTKVEYVLQVNERGKQEPKKIGLAPIQREGLDYEFDIVADLDLDHNFLVTKTRCRQLDKAAIPNPDERVGQTILAWLENGEVLPLPTTKAEVAEKPKTQRPPLAPDKLREILQKKVDNSTLRDKVTEEFFPIQYHPFGEKTAQIVASRFQAAFNIDEGLPEKPEAMYKLCLSWLTGYPSAKDISAAWADAILDWLVNGNKADKFKAAIVAPATAEALAIYEQALKEAKAEEIMGDTPWDELPDNFTERVNEDVF